MSSVPVHDSTVVTSVPLVEEDVTVHVGSLSPYRSPSGSVAEPWYRSTPVKKSDAVTSTFVAVSVNVYGTWTIPEVPTFTTVLPLLTFTFEKVTASGYGSAVAACAVFAEKVWAEVPAGCAALNCWASCQPCWAGVLPDACAAGIATAVRARAPETTAMAAVVRLRMDSPLEQRHGGRLPGRHDEKMSV